MIWPGWLEQNRIQDDLLGRAYDATPAAWRQALKTALALSHFHFGSADCVLRQERASSHLGFAEINQSHACAWTIICVSSPLDAPARLCAALALPLLAGVGNISLVFIDHQPTLACLLASELCGLEDVYAAPRRQFEILLAFLAANPQSRGKIFFLGHKWDPDLLEMADKLNLPYASSFGQPKLLLHDPDKFDVELLQFLHGVSPATDKGSEAMWDCVFAALPFAQKINARLALAPGCEGFWLFSGLAPSFFLASRASFQLHAEQPR